ncbi:MAG: nickel-dependent lactate racemase [Oscillospiraceae bacterium]|jgi:nickel-dependent lactate racemase|nr:nickel-dependent lactate racemase [Oscillospiraceae bacterium]MCI9586417.1 nickel-dependent lactate racemase [Oscillospiraceae bacterium]
MNIQLPYGKEKMEISIPDARYNGSLISKMTEYVPEKSQEELVRDALAHPIGTPKLSEMAIGKKNVVIIASDHTRPVPSKIIMPQMLSEIRKGNPDADITILISTGLHRETTKEELVHKFGEDIVKAEKIVVHDCADESNLVDLGKLPSGGELIINKLAYEADLLVAEGFIEPHFFAGFSGGRKSILPGIASRTTVCYNHNAEFIDSPYARTGVIEGNPIHEDMLYAARAAHLAFICNVVVSASHEVLFAVAGDCDRAHVAGRNFLLQYCQVDKIPADIVISTNGGYPLDQNIYQAVKGMTAAEATVNEGGVIIMVAKSSDGHGAPVFYETFKNEADNQKLMDQFRATPKEKTIPDQWQSQIFVRLLQRADVIYISDAEDEMVRNLHMIPAHSMDEAIAKADEILAGKGKKDARITVIPDGVAVIVL